MQGSSFMKTLNFMYSRDNTAFRLSFPLLKQYLLFCSTFVLLSEEGRQQQAFEYIPLIFRRRKI